MILLVQEEKLFQYSFKWAIIELQEIPREPFIALTKEEESLVKRAFSPNNRYGMINVSFDNLVGGCCNAIGFIFLQEEGLGYPQEFKY